MASVFLSASIPLPDSDARYVSTADVIAIRDSIRAFVSVVAPTGQIVFGGHPAITPLVRLLIREMALNVRERVTLYQSRFYERIFPPDVAEFERVRLIDAVPGNESASLEAMRVAMMLENEFDAGIFVGGMAGVEREYELFREYQQTKPRFPIASTGGAAQLLFRKHHSVQIELLSDLRYLSLFRRLLNPPKSSA